MTMKHLLQISHAFNIPVLVALGLGGLSARLPAADWPQWRGPDRDAKVADFTAPKTWPKELAQKWKVTVGEGVSTPALVGDKLYVFSRQDGNEVTRCLEAATGKEVWKEAYPAEGATGPSQPFSGPRSSPAVAEGKVVTLGVRGVLSCLDAAKGTNLWRKDEFVGAYPRFFSACSPLITEGLCIAQLGGPGNGGIVAYELATGEPKWKWTGDGAAYSSPVLMSIGGTRCLVAMTDKKVVALNLSDGKLAWETPFVPQGMAYNAATPIVDGQTLIYTGSGRGVKAVTFQKEGESVVSKELWSNPSKSVQFNTPVLKDGFLYGLTQGSDLFCLNAHDGQTAWSVPAGPSGGGRGARGFGSVVDAGSVLLALTPASELVVFKPDAKAYSEEARIKVAEAPTHAYPVLAGDRVFIKDRENLMLYTVD
jgi:outer membrane protein assembly factor BamB